MFVRIRSESTIIATNRAISQVTAPRGSAFSKFRPITHKASRTCKGLTFFSSPFFLDIKILLSWCRSISTKACLYSPFCRVKFKKATRSVTAFDSISVLRHVDPSSPTIFFITISDLALAFAPTIFRSTLYAVVVARPGWASGWSCGSFRGWFFCGTRRVKANGIPQYFYFVLAALIFLINSHIRIKHFRRVRRVLSQRDLKPCLFNELFSLKPRLPQQ